MKTLTKKVLQLIPTLFCVVALSGVNPAWAKHCQDWNVACKTKEKAERAKEAAEEGMAATAKVEKATASTLKKSTEDAKSVACGYQSKTVIVQDFNNESPLNDAQIFKATGLKKGEPANNVHLAVFLEGRNKDVLYEMKCSKATEEIGKLLPSTQTVKLPSGKLPKGAKVEVIFAITWANLRRPDCFKVGQNGFVPNGAKTYQRKVKGPDGKDILTEKPLSKNPTDLCSYMPADSVAMFSTLNNTLIVEEMLPPLPSDPQLIVDALRRMRKNKNE